MCKSLFSFVFFATGWGPTEGGINAVNFDLCNAMGIKSKEKHSDIYCIFSGLAPRDQDISNARMHNITLIHVNDEDFKSCNFEESLQQILNKGYEIIYWIGHDIISGKQALECKKQHGGKTVLFHHMHYADYYAVAKSADVCDQKDKEQRDIFAKGDYAIAIGPQLYDSLTNNLVVGTERLPKCKQVIPGLADIEPVDKAVTNPMTVLFAGRLEKDNDPVKQYTVPLFAVSDLVKECSYTANDIAIKLIGLKGENIDAQEDDFKKRANKRAGRVVNVKSLKFTSNRKSLFDQVRRSIVTVMPSLSEGFGLVGYESIAAGVPTIISQNSGLYKFLKEIGLERFVYSFDATGDKNIDAQSVKELIKSIVNFLPESKTRAIELRNKLLEWRYTWDRTAEDTYSFLLSEISELSLSLKEMISSEARKFLKDKVSDDYILTTANRHANCFAESLKFYKQIVLSKSIDKLCSLNNGYNIVIENEIILDFIKGFLKEIARTLKKNKAKKKVLINFTNDNCRALKNESVVNNDISSENDSEAVFEKRFKKNLIKEMKHIIIKIKSDMVLTSKDKEVIKNYHDNICTKSQYNTVDFKGVAAVVSEDPNQSKAPLNEIYVPIGLKENVRKDFAEDSFESYDRLIITGDPGSGKSIYLKNKLLEHCRSNSDRMCVFIKVAEFSKSIDIVAESNENLLEKYIATMLNEIPAANTLYKTLKDIGGVDYYIDGLDEVQDSKKKESVNGAILEFIGKAKDCRFFITSRKIGLEAQLFYPLDFEVKEIAPLSSESIELYVDKWYRFIAKIDRKDYGEQVIKLKAAIYEDEALHTLAKNPLLLSIIAILHYHGKQLPNNKAALYKTITETLLQTWLEHRNFAVLKGLSNLDNQDLTNTFSRVAHWMIENKYGEMTIGEGRFGTIYEDYCKDKKKGINTPPKKNLLRYISEDAGIVVDEGKEDGESLYKFLMHRQFAEYYAAMELDHRISAHDEDLGTKLKKVLDEPKWTEVSILMCDHLHAFGESGDIKVQKYIMELFNIKSNPVEDFQTNIQLILKWVINGVVLNEEIMRKLFACLDKIFRSKNRFRAIQFSGDLVKAFADSTNTWYQEEFCSFIKSLIDSNEYAATRNAAVVLDLLLQHEDTYKNILEKIGEEKLIKALKMIVENKEFYMLVSGGCYNTLFSEKYVSCVNSYFDCAKDKEVWINYTGVYAFGKRKTVDEKKIGNLLDKEAKLFKYDIIRDVFIHSVVFWTITFEIMDNDGEYDATSLNIDIDKWGCRALIDSAMKAENSIQNDAKLGDFCGNYTESDTRLYHEKVNGQHIFTIFCYNRDKKNVEKHSIAVPYKFSLENLREEIKKEKIEAYLPEYTYLNKLKNSEMTKEELKELFDQAYEHDRLLTGETWKQLVIDKIAENGEVFYKYFDKIKREIKFYDKLDISSLKGEALIYFRHLLGKRRVSGDISLLFAELYGITQDDAIESVGIEDKKWIISLYNDTEDEEHKAVLYEIIYNLRNVE